MTPAARLQASIELCEAIAADPRPADQAVAGSGGGGGGGGASR